MRTFQHLKLLKMVMMMFHADVLDSDVNSNWYIPSSVIWAPCIIIKRFEKLCRLLTEI